MPGARYRNPYGELVAEINDIPPNQPEKFADIIRTYCKKDLFFLLYFVLRVDINHPWIVDRVKEVEDCSNHTLDLWSRGHWKSTIMTYGLNIQEILRNPEVRIGIFSHTRSLAKAFLHRIKHTFESNTILKATFPDILWNNPGYDAPRWSLDDGIIVNRSGVYHEATVEANGLIDSMPTGKHYDVLHYDDVVTRDSVTTPEQLAKVDECFRLSFNLAAEDHFLGTSSKIRVIGTPYHFNDQYTKMKKEGGWTVRERRCIDEDGKPVLLTAEILEEKRLRMGPYVWNCQMLLNPIAKQDQRFRFEWLKWYRELPKALSLYLICDPANEKKKKRSGADYTVYWLWGIDSNNNKFLVDCVRDRLNLTERWKALKGMVKKYPRIQRVGYEQYGMAADIQHYEEMMAREGFYFSIIELAGTKLSKEDRIARLIPLFEQGRIYLPEHLEYEDKEGNLLDLIKIFVDEEYLKFPFSRHDDMLDAASRVEDKALEVSEPFDDMDGVEDGSYDVSNFFNRHAAFEDTGRDEWTGY
jgi:phage terminase large subunit-like protein